MLWHFGWSGYATGDIANALTAVVGEPNTTIHENKSLTCNLRKGRIDRRPDPPSSTPTTSTWRIGEPNHENPSRERLEYADSVLAA